MEPESQNRNAVALDSPLHVELWPRCWEVVQAALLAYNASTDRLTRPWRISDLVNRALGQYLGLIPETAEGTSSGLQASGSGAASTGMSESAKRRVNLMLAPGIQRALQDFLKSGQGSASAGTSATELINRALLQFLQKPLDPGRDP